MRVAVLGADGMLGSVVCTALQEHGDSVLAFTSAQADFSLLQLPRLDHAEALINCAGVIPEKKSTASQMLLVNSVIPHLIADKFSGRIIHVSTDCVFNGGGWGHYYYTSETPCPVDNYGRSKLAGEVNAAHVCNVRTSFVGFRHGLLRWAFSQAYKEVDGWDAAFWTGSSVYVVARRLVDILHMAGTRNIEHLATAEFITKYQALKLIDAAFNLHMTIKRADQPYINRALSPTLVLPSLEEALPELVAESERRFARS